MRFLSLWMGFMVAVSVSACNFWPKELDSLAESITQQVSGDTTAWLLGSDVIVINVAGSPSYRLLQSELEALATGIAEQALEYSTVTIESVAITFHKGEVSENSDEMREFIFLVIEKRPVLQPYLDLDATGPLTAHEIEVASDRLDDTYDRLGKPLTGEHRECVLAEAKKRAHDAGDPETLDPESVEFLATEPWNMLDAFSKRILLTQAIISKALFICAGT